MTYIELAGVLKKHGLYFGDPAGNHIDVLRNEEEQYGLFGRKRRTVVRRIAQIGFPRWTAQVGAGALKTVLREAGLTVQNGYDSEVVFGSASPLYSLIEQYRGPFIRLQKL